MIKYLAFILVVAAAVSAYDFGDANFNEYLFEDLKADYEEAVDTLARSRRDAPPTDRKQCGRRGGKKDFCCKTENPDAEPSEEYKEAKKQCQIEIRGNAEEPAFDPFNCEKMQQVKQQVVCVSECVGKKMNFVDANGDFNRESILKEIRRNVGENPAGLEAVEAMVDHCVALVKEKKASGSGAGDSEGCSHGPLEFHHCIWQEFANSCPAEMRIDSPRCNKIRERLDKGDSSVLNKFFLHQFHHMRHEE